MSKELTAEPARRRRRWAPKVRTGCSTCRIRRVKCDETQPVCRKCVVGRYTCQYSLIWRPEPEIGHQPSNVLCLSPLRQAHLPDDDIMQAIRYRIEVIYPRQMDLRLVDDTVYLMSHEDVRLHISGHTSPPAFILMQLADRVLALCQDNRVLAQHGSLPGCDPLWRSFYTYMGKAIEVLNQHIASRYPAHLTLCRISELVCIGLCFLDLPWRSHTRGFLALVQHHGGIQAIMDSDKVPSPMQSVHYILTNTAMANTTSPVTDQVFELHEWTDEECLRIYNYTFSDCLVCPSIIFMSLLRITRLRVAVSTGVSTAELAPIAELIAHDIRGFAEETWTEIYDLPPPNMAVIYARAFKAATAMYGLLSLPRALARFFEPHLDERPDTAGAAHGHQAQRRILWDAVIQAERNLGTPAGRLCWPLAVLGVSCYDATQHERDTVSAELLTMWDVHGVACGPVMMHQALLKFWGSGKTTWDECFDKPMHPVI